MTTGERIKQRREELGLTQTELAERMGYKSRAAICTVEKDKEDLTTTRIRKFAKALQTTPAYLMGWEEVGLEEQIMYADVNQDPEHLKNITYTAEQLEKAFALLEKYESADKDIKTVVDTLLKRPQQES